MTSASERKLREELADDARREAINAKRAPMAAGACALARQAYQVPGIKPEAKAYLEETYWSLCDCLRQGYEISETDACNLCTYIMQHCILPDPEPLCPTCGVVHETCTRWGSGQSSCILPYEHVGRCRGQNGQDLLAETLYLVRREL